MTLSFKVTRRRTLVAFAALALVSASIALAAWLIDGSGSGKAQLGTLVAPTVTATGTPSAQAIPGSNGSLVLNVDNPNSGPLVITGAAFAGGFSPIGPPVAGCSTEAQAQISGLSVADAVGKVLPPGQSFVQVANAYSLGSGSPNACQGTSWSVPLAFNYSTQ